MELILYTRYLGRLESEIREQQQAIDALSRDKEDKRIALMTTLKDRKVKQEFKVLLELQVLMVKDLQGLLALRVLQAKQEQKAKQEPLVPLDQQELLE